MREEEENSASDFDIQLLCMYLPPTSALLHSVTPSPSLHSLHLSLLRMQTDVREIEKFGLCQLIRNVTNIETIGILLNLICECCSVQNCVCCECIRASTLLLLLRSSEVND